MNAKVKFISFLCCGTDQSWRWLVSCFLIENLKKTTDNANNNYYYREWMCHLWSCLARCCYYIKHLKACITYVSILGGVVSLPQPPCFFKISTTVLQVSDQLAMTYKLNPTFNAVVWISQSLMEILLGKFKLLMSWTLNLQFFNRDWKLKIEFHI